MVILHELWNKFGVQPDLGFLGHFKEDIRLPIEFTVLENVALRIPALLLSGNLKTLVQEKTNRIPISCIFELDNRQCEVAFSLYTFLLHALVRSNRNVDCILPQEFSQQLIILADRVGSPPIATYASTVTFNWRRFEFKSFDPDNFVVLSDFYCKYLLTGSMDEAWFYLVSAAVDFISPQIISQAIDLLNHPHSFCWKKITLLIRQSTCLLKRMYEENMPEYFYQKIRFYLSGWINDPQLPKGVLYTFPDGKKEWLQLHGASAAQSPTIQLLDIMLGIKHESTGQQQESTGVGRGREFLLEMRNIGNSWNILKVD